MGGSPDTVIVGGGLVGSAIGYGLARAGLRALLLDEGDVAFRASRGNFGLVWVQGKGVDMPRYAEWTRRSADLWPAFAAELRERTGADLQLAQPGGVHICLSPEELEERGAQLKRLSNSLPEFRYEMLDRDALAGLIPGLGPEVAGASFCPHDGHVNPLRLFRALLQPGNKAWRIMPAFGSQTRICRNRENFPDACIFADRCV